MKFKYSKISSIFLVLLYIVATVLTLKGVLGFYTLTAYFTILAVLYVIISLILQRKNIFTRKVTSLLIKYMITVICISAILLFNDMSNIKFYLIVHIFFVIFFALRFKGLNKIVNSKPKKEVTWADINISLQHINKLIEKLPGVILDNISQDIQILNEVISESPIESNKEVHLTEKKISDGILALDDLIQLMLDTNRFEYSIVTNKVSRIKRLVQERADILAKSDS